MTEWWTYRPSDFLMFSPRAYHRLFELYNQEVWPAQLATVAVGLAVALVWWQRRAGLVAITYAVFGVLWGWVAFGFLSRHLGTIHTAAGWCTAAFALQAALLVLCEAAVSARRGQWVVTRRAFAIGLGLMLFALLLQPGSGVLQGRPLAQAEVFGLAPDPTVVATLGLLTISSSLPPRWLARLLWVVPLAWCAIGGMTLWTMGEPEAVVMPAAALLALYGASGRAAQRAAA